MKLTGEEKKRFTKLKSNFNLKEDSLEIEEMKELRNLFSKENECKENVKIEIEAEIQSNKRKMERLGNLIPIKFREALQFKSEMNERLK